MGLMFGCERQRGIKGNCEVLAYETGRMELPVTKMGKADLGWDGGEGDASQEWFGGTLSLRCQILTPVPVCV